MSFVELILLLFAICYYAFCLFLFLLCLLFWLVDRHKDRSWSIRYYEKNARIASTQKRKKHR